MALLSRRSFLRVAGAGALSGGGLSSYSFAAEPRFRLSITHYRLRPPGWPVLDRPLRIAALADIHGCEPWMPLSRIEDIVDTTNALQPDMIVLLGDYVAGLRRFRSAIVPCADWGRAFGRLQAPLGVHGVLGNHDWWDDLEGVRTAFADNDIPLMENEVTRISSEDAPPFWLAGLGDQLALPLGRGRFEGVHDLPGTLARVTDDAPVILLAHEPDIFAEVPDRVSLTLSGHTHGGQVALPFVNRPAVPSKFADRFAYGHFVEEGRHLVVSGGLGCSVLPVRVGIPPEIVMVELG